MRPTLPAGLVVELVSPLTPTYTVDPAGLARLLQHCLPAAAGLMGGSLQVGEALAWEAAGRLALFRELLQLLPPNVPLFFCLTAGDPAATRTLAQDLENLLAAAGKPPPVFWVDLPLIYHSNRGLPQYYRELATVLSRPLILWNQPEIVRPRRPAFRHGNLRTAVVKKLATLPGIAGLVFHGSLRRLLHYHTAAARQPDFVFYEADEERFLHRPGSRGLVSAGAQLFPQLWQQVTLACLFLQEMEATRLWSWSRLLLQLIQAYRPFPAPLLKVALQELSVLEKATVLPTTPSPAPEVIRNFREIVRQVKAQVAGVQS